MIGVFDSGVGGLSVWSEIFKLLPNHRYIYVSDNGHCPYGPKSQSYIIDRTRKISDFLIKEGADIIVVACNTATAAAINVLRSEFSIPFVGMEPAVKPAALHSQKGVIGVLATYGTFRGELYLGTLQKFASEIKVIEQVGDGLVELVENGKTETLEAEKLLSKYITPMIEAGADHLVLGCTHYPFLIKSINKITENKIIIVNPAPAIAKRTVELLGGKLSEDNSSVEDNIFYTTGDNLHILEKMVNEIVDSSIVTSNRKNTFHKAEI